MRENGVKRRLKAGRPSVGTWLSLPCPEAARFLSQIGFDWLTVDTEHQPIDLRDASQMFAAVAASIAPDENPQVATIIPRVPWGYPASTPINSRTMFGDTLRRGCQHLH